MKKSGRWFVPAVLILFAVALVFACGGGGDDDDSGPPDPPSGPTNTIDTATIDDLMQRVNDMGIGCTTDGSALRFSTTIDTLEALAQETVNKVSGAYRARQTDGISAVAVELDPIILNSTCPGSTGQMRIDVTYDDETGAFSGTLAFTEFCLYVEEIGEVNVAGGATFSGQIGFDSEENLNSITLNAGTTSPIVVTSGEDSASVTVTGLSFSFSEASDGSLALSLCWTSLDIDITDGADSESIDTDDVCISVTVTSEGAITVDISATITTDDGSLGVSTPTPFTVDSSGNITGGVLQIDGADDTAVQIGYAGSGYAFTVQADTDGDGEYDDYSEEMDCTELGDDILDIF
jgi:hypothetical protein